MVIQYKGIKYQWAFFKFFVNICIILAILVIMISYVSSIAKATFEPKQITITVHRGDTLWSIARKLDPNSDPRRVIEEIKQRNNLKSSALMKGQRLQLIVDRN